MTAARATFLMLGLGLLAGVAVPSAQASDTDIFASCDGLGKPGKSPGGLSGPANAARFSEFSVATNGVVSACDAALAHPKLLPSQGLRRAHLLRARALAYVRGGKLDEALKDIDAAGTAAGPSATDPLYARSFAVSLDLVRALVYDRMGKTDEALRLARQSAAARPFAVEVQRVAAHLLLTHRQQDEEAAATIRSANRLDPDFILYQTSFLALLGDFKAMAALEIPMPALVESEDDKKDPSRAALANLNAAREQLRSRLTLAYARAATGDGEGARRGLAETRSRYETLASSASATLGEEARKRLLKGDGDLIAAYDIRINARIALAEGRRQDAEALINDKGLPLDSISTDLFVAMRDKPTSPDASRPFVAPPSASDIPDEQAATVRKQLFDKMLWLAVVEPETAKTNSVYKRSRPNVLGALVGAAVTMGVSLLQGVDNTDGFSAKQNDDGSVRVSLTGATPAPAVVREMVLLRAAELALENKKPAFEIVGREDYARFQTTSRQGFEISRIPAGYKSDIVIRFVEADAANARMLDARMLVESLGPYYYRDDRK